MGEGSVDQWAMPKRNEHPGQCDVCGAQVNAGEGLLEASEDRRGYTILCPEHAPAGVLDPPRTPIASKLPSIHLDGSRYER
jgi:hypothetical protein